MPWLSGRPGEKVPRRGQGGGKEGASGSARAESPLVLGLGTACLGSGWVSWPEAPAPPLVPLLPTGWPWPQPRWRLGCAGAAAFPGPSVRQPQAQVPVGPGGWGDLGELGGTGDRVASQRGMGGPCLSKPRQRLSAQSPFSPGHPFPAPKLVILTPRRDPHSWLPPIPAVWTRSEEATTWKRTPKSSRCCRRTERGGRPPGSPAPSDSCRRPWRPRREVGRGGGRAVRVRGSQWMCC